MNLQESAPLAIHETKSLSYQEEVIDKGRKTFVEVGKALTAIRDGKLYRETHDTFGDYCRERWGWERRQAYRLIDAAGVSENVSKRTQENHSRIHQNNPATYPPAPTSEFQSRPVQVD